MNQIVIDATSELSTSENWHLFIEICEKSKSSETLARDTIAALILRINHKNINVVLLSLTLCNALVSNDVAFAKREISSRAFMGCLSAKLHSQVAEVVKDRILEVVESWAEVFKSDPQLSFFMSEYYKLKDQGFLFPSVKSVLFVKPADPPKESLRRNQEQEDFDTAIAMSLSVKAQKSEKPAIEQPARAAQIQKSKSFAVVALFPYTASSSTELSFQTHDQITVSDATTYKDWWTGTLNGQTGIFPANYVERVVTTDILAVSNKCDVFVDVCMRGGRPDDLQRLYSDLMGHKSALLRELSLIERRVAEEDALQREIKSSNAKYFAIMSNAQKY